jgi:hypothetical protein
MAIDGGMPAFRQGVLSVYSISEMVLTRFGYVLWIGTRRGQ